MSVFCSLTCFLNFSSQGSKIQMLAVIAPVMIKALFMIAAQVSGHRTTGCAYILGGAIGKGVESHHLQRVAAVWTLGRRWSGHL